MFGFFKKKSSNIPIIMPSRKRNPISHRLFSKFLPLSSFFVGGKKERKERKRKKKGEKQKTSSDRFEEWVGKNVH